MRFKDPVMIRLGQVLADAGNTVTMWAKEQQIVEGIRDHHHNASEAPRPLHRVLR